MNLSQQLENLVNAIVQPEPIPDQLRQAANHLTELSNEWGSLSKNERAQAFLAAVHEVEEVFVAADESGEMSACQSEMGDTA